MTVGADVRVRALRREDWEALSRIDAAHSGVDKPDWWRDTVRRHLRRPSSSLRVGLTAVEGGEPVGYLLGQVRAFEFGSEPCGWIYAVGVRPDHLRTGVARRLLDEARTRFRRLGVGLLRTMVRRNDLPTLTFFRSAGFVAGPYVELEQRLVDAARAPSPPEPETES